MRRRGIINKDKMIEKKGKEEKSLKEINEEKDESKEELISKNGEKIVEIDIKDMKGGDGDWWGERMEIRCNDRKWIIERRGIDEWEIWVLMRKKKGRRESIEKKMEEREIKKEIKLKM